MFSAMVDSLKTGKFPEPDALKKRLAAALIKKGGILQQPRPCWSNDPKINPAAKHILWAATVLEDDDSIAIAAGLAAMEIQAGKPGITGKEIGAELGAMLDELASFAVEPHFREILFDRVRKAKSLIPRP